MATQIVPPLPASQSITLAPLLIFPDAVPGALPGDLPTDIAQDLAGDIEILFADRQALADLAASILENKRLASLIVQGWLKQHHRLLIAA